MQLFLSKEQALLTRQSELMAELLDLRLFAQMREDLLKELETTKGAMRETEARHREQLQELERRFLLARQQLEAEAAARINRSRATYKEEVGKGESALVSSWPLPLLPVLTPLTPPLPVHRPLRRRRLVFLRPCRAGCGVPFHSRGEHAPGARAAPTRGHLPALPEAGQQAGR